MEIPLKRSTKGVVLKIRVEPRSSKKGIAGIIGDTLKVKVHSPPVGGAANEELIEILSEKFKIKKSLIKIIRGHTARDKVIEIEGIDSIS